VLWCAVLALQKALPKAKILVLCDGRLSPSALRASAKEVFGVELLRDVEVIPLSDVGRLAPARHPRLTLVSQSLAGAVLAFEGLRRCCCGGSVESRNENGGRSGGSEDENGDENGNGEKRGLPALFVDTSGWPLSHFVAKAAGCSVAAYVHYPIVSSDMLRRVGGGEGGGGEGEGSKGLAVAGGGARFSPSSSSRPSPSLSQRLRASVKTAYYHAVAAVYGAAGGICDVAVANSSWTAGHLEELWWRRPRMVSGRSSSRSRSRSSSLPSPSSSKEERGKLFFSSSTIVYPPCGVSSLSDLPLERAPLPEEVFGKKKTKEGKLLVALAQFRPEKNQATLLRALALARDRARAAAAAKSSSSSPSSPPHPVLSARLALVGGVRDAADAGRVEELRALARELGLLTKKKEDEKPDEDEKEKEDFVVFVANAPRETLRLLLSSALGGLHAMVDEHFGICVVEYMSAGVVPIAHDSAGPRMDIVRDEEEEEEGGGGEVDESENGNDGGDDDGGSARRRKEASSSSSKSPTSSSATPTGFLCSTVEEYADAITELLVLSEEGGSEGQGQGKTKKTTGKKKEEEASSSTSSALRMAASARRRALRLFTDEAFDAGFVEALRTLLKRVQRGCEQEEEKEKKKKKSK